MNNEEFGRFIRDNKCDEKGCWADSPFPHTHKLISFHDNIAPEKCECGRPNRHIKTEQYNEFGTNQAGYITDFSCGDYGCDYKFRISTPANEETKNALCKLEGHYKDFKIVLMED